MTRIAFHPATVPLRTLSTDNDTVQAGRYEATTLSAVDVDLAVGNIKDGVTIFGKLGTYDRSLAEDLVGNGAHTANSAASGKYFAYEQPAGSDYVFATTTDTYAEGSMAVAVGTANVEGHPSWHKMQLVMGGVQVAESGFYSDNNSRNIIVVATRALSGEQTCLVQTHNYSGSSESSMYGGSVDGTDSSGAIGVGSIKLV